CATAPLPRAAWHSGRISSALRPAPHLLLGLSCPFFTITRSKSIRHPGGDIVDVSTWTGLFQKCPGREVRVDRHQCHMAVEPPFRLHRRLTPDIARAARLPRTNEIDGRPVNPVAQALPPKENPVGGHCDVLGQMKIERG